MTSLWIFLSLFLLHTLSLSLSLSFSLSFSLLLFFFPLCLVQTHSSGARFKYESSFAHAVQTVFDTDRSSFLCVFVCVCACACFFQAAGRRSRQAEGEELEGVWSPWGEWGECSQSCGMGVSERKRQCLPPPQTPPQTWPGSAYLPPGVPNHSPVISAIRPYHPSVYPGNEGPHYGGGGVGNRQPSYPPAQPTNPNPGLPLYRSEPGVGGPNQPSHMAPFYPPANQDTASLYQPSSYPSSGSSPALSYGQSGRPSRRQPNHGPGRSEGGGSRRSVSNNRDSLSFRR